MRTAVQILVAVLLIAGAGAFALWMIDRRPEVEAGAVVPALPVVRVITARAAPIDLEVHGRGEVLPRERLGLTSEVAGRVRAIAPVLVSGGSFTAGDVLVELDPIDLEAAEARAAAAVESAKLSLARRRTEASLAERQYAQLGEGEPSDLALGVPQVREAEALLAAAQADLSLAERNVERSRLVAPFDGRVRSEDVAVGQLVARGQVLAELFATDRVEVRILVPTGELAHLGLDRAGVQDTGAAARLTAKFAGATRRWQGRLLRVEGEVDRTSRMAVLVIGVHDPLGEAAELAGAPLLPGLFVDVVVVGRHETSAILVPRIALRSGSKLLVVDDEDRLWFRPIEIGWSDSDRALVTTGLVEGARVCTSPLAAPVDGMTVRVLEDGDSGTGGEVDR